MNILDKIKINELGGEDYIVVFPVEVLNEGYHACNEILIGLRRAFPQKKFYGIPENIEFKKYSTEELELSIKFLQEEINSRNERP